MGDIHANFLRGVLTIVQTKTLAEVCQDLRDRLFSSEKHEDWEAHFRNRKWISHLHCGKPQPEYWDASKFFNIIFQACKCSVAENVCNVRQREMNSCKRTSEPYHCFLREIMHKHLLFADRVLQTQAPAVLLDVFREALSRDSTIKDLILKHNHSEEALWARAKQLPLSWAALAYVLKDARNRVAHDEISKESAKGGMLAAREFLLLASDKAAHGWAACIDLVLEHWTDDEWLKSRLSLLHTSDPSVELIKAAARGDVENVKLMLDHPECNVDALELSEKGFSALHFACHRGHITVVEALLQSGADCDVRRSSNKSTPLHVAAAAGFVDGMKLLLDKGADPSPFTTHGWSPLHNASAKNQPKALQMLLETPGVHVHPCPGQHANDTLLAAEYSRLCGGSWPPSSTCTSGHKLCHIVPPRSFLARCHHFNRRSLDRLLRLCLFLGVCAAVFYFAFTSHFSLADLCFFDF
eukprot:m.55888 g.55888  ORF g.55888 m.55888 type:complete len:468 (+) comp15657_c1_seq3:140-1543(+)